MSLPPRVAILVASIDVALRDTSPGEAKDAYEQLAELFQESAEAIEEEED